jgi:outer membrane protein OmpA-like peptidoglycan-associated protein
MNRSNAPVKSGFIFSRGSIMAVAKDRRPFHGLRAAGTLAALASFGFLAPAYAQDATGTAVPAPTQGFYIGGGLGANVEESNRFRQGGAQATDTYTPGFAGLADFGWGLGNGLRFELEPGYRNNTVDRINGGPGSGHTQEATLMGNVLYDFNYVTPIVPLQPHVGVGAGYAHVWDRSAPQSGNAVSGQSDVPAFQGIVGLDYAVTPSTKVGVDYHYLVAHDATFHVNNGLTTHAGDLDNHTFLLTMRYQFNTPTQAPPPVQPAAFVPPAAPPAAPAPVEARPYEVYFDFDSSRLTSDGRAVVDQAANNAKKGQTTHIMVTGHTDTVGTSSYNQVLSVKRADAVRAALIADGISKDEIQTSGVGKNDLAVPTADNINEPRNRRVEVVIQAPGM